MSGIVLTEGQVYKPFQGILYIISHLLIDESHVSAIHDPPIVIENRIKEETWIRKNNQRQNQSLEWRKL